MDTAKAKVLELTENALAIIDTFPVPQKELRQLVTELTGRRK